MIFLSTAWIRNKKLINYWYLQLDEAGQARIHQSKNICCCIVWSSWLPGRHQQPNGQKEVRNCMSLIKDRNPLAKYLPTNLT